VPYIVVAQPSSTNEVGSYKHSSCLSTFPLCTNSSVPLVWHVDFVPLWASTEILTSCISTSRSNWLVVWWEVPVLNWNILFFLFSLSLLLSCTPRHLLPHFAILFFFCFCLLGFSLFSCFLFVGATRFFGVLYSFPPVSLGQHR